MGALPTGGRKIAFTINKDPCEGTLSRTVSYFYKMHELTLLLQIFLTVLTHFFKVLQEADIHLLKFINLHSITFLDTFFIFMTNVATAITFSVPIILLIYAYSKHRFVLQRKSWLILITLTINSAIVAIIKYAVNRPRPFITYPFLHNLVSVQTPSFPSGHAAEVFMLAISLSLLFPKQKWGITFSWVWALLIAYSRMDLGVHYPSDILGSIIVTSIVAFAFITLMIHLGFLQKKTTTEPAK